MEDNLNKENALLTELQPKISIQEAFKKFQKQKFYQLKLNKYLQNTKIDRSSLEFKAQLRQKFVQTAHKYIGVPYCQKYHNKGDPLFDAPLFLDCCALIRQCVFDLRQEFGYTLGKWNQSYQFDLLPDEKLSQNDLKPGDLIFYSATYNNPKLKPFPHKMVHVQIYLGEGKSIGARWQKGTIQVFDSYKFQSSLYHDIQFHYRSIDSWLEGKFISHCIEHKWLDQRANQWLSDKFSVFADPSLDDINLKQCQKVDQKGVFVGKGNNSKLVQNFFSEKENYSIMSEKQQFSPHFFFKWVQSTGEIDFHSFQEGKQIVNHIPNIHVITQKLQLLKTLKDLQLDLQQDGKQMVPKLSEFLPKTYRLDVMSDEIQFINDKSTGIWIYKPRNLNQGRGIKLIGNISKFKEEFVQSKKFYLGQFALNNMIHYKPQLNPALQAETSSGSEDNKNQYSSLKQDGLIQHYIRPLLINKKKFDIRCYLFFNSSPCIALFHPGYLRLTIEDYSEENIENEQNLMIHLTNNCFQNKHKLYKQRKDETIGKWDLIVKQIGQQATSDLKHKIKLIMIAIIAAAKRKLMKKKGTYELLGCDILVGDNLQPYLLEVNTNPAMFTDTQVQKQLLPKLMRNTLGLVLDLFEKQDSQEIFKNACSYEYDQLYCEQSKWVYGVQEGHDSSNGLLQKKNEQKVLKNNQLLNNISEVVVEKNN